MLIQHKNTGDKLSIAAAEWNTIADTINALNGRGRTPHKQLLKGRFVLSPHDQRRQFSAGDILAFVQKIVVTTDPGLYNDAAADVAFPDWADRERFQETLPPAPIYAMALSSNTFGADIPIVATGLVYANFSEAIDCFPLEGLQVFFGFESSLLFAEVDNHGKLYPVTYPTGIQVVSINRNSHQGMVLLNCGIRPCGPFDTRMYYDNGQWKVLCYNSMFAYVRGRSWAGPVVGGSGGGGGSIYAMEFDLDELSVESTIQYDVRWERPDDEHPGSYTKQQLEIVNGKNQSYYRPGRYTEAIAHIEKRSVENGNYYPVITHLRPLANIVIPDITY